jgi:hypothetical protein
VSQRPENCENSTRGCRDRAAERASFFEKVVDRDRLIGNQSVKELVHGEFRSAASDAAASVHLDSDSPLGG